MAKMQKFFIVLLRLALGWFMFYAGITKVLNAGWSAEGYLRSAKTLPELFSWFLQPGVLPVINFVNEWGLTLLGVSLILGIFVRLSSVLGAVLMLLYYLPILKFPIVGEHSYIVDEHVIYILVLLFFAVLRAGRVWGLDGKLFRRSGISRLLG